MPTRMRTRPRKRTLLPRMLLLLTGGAIINVAVAWGLALGINLSANTVPPAFASAETESGRWEVMRFSKLGATRISSRRLKPMWDSQPLAVGDPCSMIPSWLDFCNPSSRFAGLPENVQELQFADGSTMRNDFTNVVVNQPVDFVKFDAKIPAGYSVVEPMRQQ